MFENSVAMSTFDCSSEPPVMRPPAAASGRSDRRRSGRQCGLEAVLPHPLQALRIGKVRQYNLTQSQSLIVGE